MFSKSKFAAQKENQMPKFTGARNPESSLIINDQEVFTLLKGIYEHMRVATEQQQTLITKVDALEVKLAKLSLKPQVIDAPLQAPVVA
jgi:hypothetical protein